MVEAGRCRPICGLREVDVAAAELRAEEADVAAAELRAAEVAAVEDDAGEVEVEAVPGGECGGAAVVGLEVVFDDADHGVADFRGWPAR